VRGAGDVSDGLVPLPVNLGRVRHGFVVLVVE
jgi:hypothetical protein